MSEVKRGALQSPASAAKTADTVVRHVQVIDPAGNVTGGGSEASGYESVTVSGTTGGLTAGTYGDAVRAIITVETAQIRARWDGTSPTASEGHILQVDDVLILYSAADIANFEAIRTGATSGVIKVTYSE